MRLDRNAGEGYWEPYTTGPNACARGADWVSLLRTANEELSDLATWEERTRRQAAIERLSWLRGKTILLIGDSVDRNALGHLGDLTGSRYWPSDYANASYEGEMPGWDVRGQPWRVHLKALDAYVHNAFYYGLDDRDDFQGQPDWHPPGFAEDRIDGLFLPYTSTLGRKVDMIQLHSGMWDMALCSYDARVGRLTNAVGRRDAQSRVDTATPLSKERTDWWRQRTIALVEHVRRAWPDTPIWYRKIHRVGEHVGYSTGDYVFGMHDHDRQNVTNFFTDIRLQNLRELQQAVAEELCLPIFDFGHVWEVHPNTHSGGVMYNNPMLHHLWMETQGREKWSKLPCSDYVPGRSNY